MPILHRVSRASRAGRYAKRAAARARKVQNLPSSSTIIRSPRRRCAIVCEMVLVRPRLICPGRGWGRRTRARGTYRYKRKVGPASAVSQSVSHSVIQCPVNRARPVGPFHFSCACSYRHATVPSRRAAIERCIALYRVEIHVENFAPRAIRPLGELKLVRRSSRGLFIFM